MPFRVFRTKTFEKEFGKLPNTEQVEIEKFERNLSENPFVGKPLGYSFFREKKLNSRRVYYLVYEEFVVVLMTAIGTKKNQHTTINAIKEKMEEYRESVREALKNV